MTGLYIHIPFCKQKCKYCDFASFAGRENLIDDYLDALSKEAARFANAACNTLYIGGGTPSLLSRAQLEKLINLIEKNFAPIPSFAESTFEANPESLTREKIALLHHAGINRFSMGLQSFNDDELKRIGRIHSSADFLRAWEDLHTGGVQNVNVDLIAGLPGQTLESFLHSLEKLTALSPQHISVYGLQIEEGTPFFEQGVLCDQLLMRRMLEETRERLLKAGYHHYEISNFARPGAESKHNLNYWQYGEYIGLGSAAASFINGERRQNTEDITDYIARIKAQKSAVDFSEKLTGKKREGEKLLVGLRQLDGVELTPVQQRYFATAIEKHIQNGLLVRENKKVKLSEEGLYLANEVFYSFVAPFDNV
ncbi:radical SAM family heme chaperone HemW [Candidatus Avelusimicrobium luingense]|uniref:radical SAM family heme chaperone HemW n=1 Tax=Candidatus Avelusimicrobium luingense TaxID=3416211 RepID=UPI003D0E4797